VDGIETQSYGTDAALLAELREAWPPDDAPPTGAAGYVATDLAGREPTGAVRLTERLAIALAPDGDGHLVVPLVRSVSDAGATGWRRAVAGDGLSALVAGAPMASERPIEADQTNASVVVGERAIVKWFRRVGPRPSRAAVLLEHLDAVGFDGIPTPLGAVAWRAPSGVDLVVAQGDAFLPGARDGWEWCVERAARHVAHGRAACPSGCDPWVGERLGRLVAGLHAALRTPSPAIAAPVEPATPADLARWTIAALATLDDAVARTAEAGRVDGARLSGVVGAMRDELGGLSGVDPSAVELQPVHGDLHVGQVLAWDGGLAVIDFDGNPTLPPEANALRQPAARDVAQLTTSLDHVGRIVDDRSGGRWRGRVADWIAANRRALLDEVDVDERLLAAFEVEQECRELVYAARFLPRWRYAPLAALEARYAG
jgi:maltokinase